MLAKQHQKIEILGNSNANLSLWKSNLKRDNKKQALGRYGKNIDFHPTNIFLKLTVNHNDWN